MDSDLLKIGAQCSISSCGLVDFLPIACPECRKSFCSNHVSWELHKCTGLDSRVELPSGSSKPLRRCGFEGCKKLSLQMGNGPETCLACRKSFCVDHRHLDNHNCPSLIAETDTKSSKIRVSSSVPRPKPPTRVRKPPTDPVKLAQWQKMELMKMRHRAVPADPKDKISAAPPPEQRLHAKILVDENQTEKVFWLRKTVVTGRALDLFASQLSLTFDGNPTLSLNKIATDTEALIPLRNDQLLVDQMEDGTTLVVAPAI